MTRSGWIGQLEGAGLIAKTAQSNNFQRQDRRDGMSPRLFSEDEHSVVRNGVMGQVDTRVEKPKH